MSEPAGGLSQVVIRPAEPRTYQSSDGGALLVQLHHEFDPARFVAAPPRTEHLYAAFLADQLGKPNGVVLVAEMGGEVLGYTYATVEDSDYMALRGPAGLFHDLVVDPAHRGNVSAGAARRHAGCAQSSRCATGRALDRGAERRRPAPLRTRGVSAHDDRNDA